MLSWSAAILSKALQTASTRLATSVWGGGIWGNTEWKFTSAAVEQALTVGRLRSLQAGWLWAAPAIYTHSKVTILVIAEFISVSNWTPPERPPWACWKSHSRCGSSWQRQHGVLPETVISPCGFEWTWSKIQMGWGFHEKWIGQTCLKKRGVEESSKLHPSSSSSEKQHFLFFSLKSHRCLLKSFSTWCK